MSDDNVLLFRGDRETRARAAWATAPTDDELARVLAAPTPIRPTRAVAPRLALAALALGLGGLAAAAVATHRTEPAPAPIVVPAPAIASPPVAPTPVIAPTPPVAPRATPTPADQALFARIQDHLDQGRAPEALISELDRFLTGFPRSRFAPEAGALRLGLRAKVEAPVVVLAESEAWLAAYPADARSSEVHALAGRMARDGLHDCARALPHDRAAAAGTTGAARAVAATWSGLCALTVGDREGGLADLRSVDPADLPPALAAARASALATAPGR